MNDDPRWNEQEGTLWMEKDGFRLVVHLPRAQGYAHFVVIDHHGLIRHQDRLIGSGTVEGVGAARDAAERMAERLGRSGIIGLTRDGSAPMRSRPIGPHGVA
ncbi:MAG: hypothetical protein M0Z28_27835 [Rhodospirillales bacterium]|nr:hypothetical protein [Rhodospirillales bacterium]